jgi:hypothetical protein
LFGVLSVFDRRIKWMIRLRPEQVLTFNVTLHVHTSYGHNHPFDATVKYRQHTERARNANA